jgi:hypothetical protein
MQSSSRSSRRKAVYLSADLRQPPGINVHADRYRPRDERVVQLLEGGEVARVAGGDAEPEAGPRFTPSLSEAQRP